MCWNKKTLRNSGALQQCVEFAPTEDRPQACKERNMTSAEIVDFCAANPQTIHIEWDGVNHYAALLGTSPVPIESNIITALCSVDPVTRQKPPAPAKAAKRPASGLPAGWTRLDDKIRTDAADCKVVTTKRTIDKHLSEALKGSFNAVLVLTVGGERATKYLRYDFNLTASDCADTANFNTELYIHAPGGKRRKTAAPIDPQASCFCNKFYRKSVPEIGCTRCNRFCHVSCAFPGASTKQVNAAMRSFKCPACAAGSQ